MDVIPVEIEQILDEVEGVVYQVRVVLLFAVMFVRGVNVFARLDLRFGVVEQKVELRIGAEELGLEFVCELEEHLDDVGRYQPAVVFAEGCQIDRMVASPEEIVGVDDAVTVEITAVVVRVWFQRFPLLRLR